MNQSSRVEYVAIMPQIYNRKTDLNILAEHFIACKTCFQSEQTIKQMKNRPAHDLLAVKSQCSIVRKTPSAGAFINSNPARRPIRCVVDQFFQLHLI